MFLLLMLVGRGAVGRLGGGVGASAGAAVGLLQHVAVGDLVLVDGGRLVVGGLRGRGGLVPEGKGYQLKAIQRSR